MGESKDHNEGKESIIRAMKCQVGRNKTKEVKMNRTQVMTLFERIFLCNKSCNYLNFI